MNTMQVVAKKENQNSGAQPTSRSNYSANQNEQMEISVIQAPNGCIHKV